jgi:hypothetical protein
MATQQELVVPPGHFAMQGPDGSAIFFPVGTPQEAVDAEMERVYGTQEDTAHYEQPGLSEANPIDLRTATPDEAASLTRGTWVRGEDGTVYALPEDAYRGATRPGDVTLESGLVQRPQSPASDIAQSLGAGLIQGVTSTVGMPGDIRDLSVRGVVGLRNMLSREEDLSPEAAIQAAQSARPMLTGGQIDTAVQDQFGEYYQPQTTAGEYARTIGQFAPGAAAPGGPLARIASVLAPALTSETAGQLTEGRPEEGAARVIGGLLGGVPVGVTQMVRSGPQNVIRNAAKGVTEQNLADATRLRTEAERLGIALTQAEALQQVTGGATGLGRVQRVVEGSSNAMAPMMAQRPAQVRGAVQNLIDQVGAPVAPAEATRLGQETAEGVLNTMRQRVNENARPFYDALPGQTLDPADAQALQANPSYAAAQEAVLSNPELAPLISGGPEDLSTVNRVIQQLDQMEAAATPGVFNPQGNRTIAGQRGQARTVAQEAATRASPDFATARQTVATGREAFVDPLTRGPIGTLAGQAEMRPTLPQQTAALFPAVPAEGQADQTLLALQLMGEVNPQAGPALTRQFLATQANELLQDNATGPNQFGGAKLAAALMGNPEQERALIGAIDQAAPFNDARRLAEVLRATGQREAGGSQTAFNTQIQEGMRAGNMGQETVQSIVNPTSIPGRLSRRFDNFMAERNAERLAEILMADPATAEREIRRAMIRRSGGNRIRAGVALTQGGED